MPVAKNTRPATAVPRVSKPFQSEPFARYAVTARLTGNTAKVHILTHRSERGCEKPSRLTTRPARPTHNNSHTRVSNKLPKTMSTDL